MPDAKRTFKIITEQRILEDAESPSPNLPLRHWSIQIVVIHQETKQEVAADCFRKVVYKLHESFGPKEKQEKKTPPFRIEEDGWGEFVMEIFLTDLAGKEHVISHDLNFSQERYDMKHVVTFKNPKGDLAAALRASGLVPGDAAGDVANGKRGRRISGVGGADGETGKKRKKADTRGIDMDTLAKNLQVLGEDDLLLVVQMVHTHKSSETWTMNDVDQGEFHVDLYTLPEALIKMLWDFSNEKLGTS